MIFDALGLLSLGLAYLIFLFLIAHLSESGLFSTKWIRNPTVYVLSLGVYISAWGVYGVVGFAYETGYNFLAFYLGISGAFLLAPVLLSPILRLTKNHQLSSLADLFAFRYRSQWVGSLTTIFMLLALLPLLALQIRAVSDTANILTQQQNHYGVAIIFCCAITLFTLLFGAKPLTPQYKHDGLVVTIAVEAIVKLVMMLTVAGYALFSVFDGTDGLTQWLAHNKDALELLYIPLKENGIWHSLILAFLFSAVVMPYMYHMVFTENFQPRSLLTASWGFPLYLWLMALCVPLILWAGIKLELGVNPEYFTIAIAQASQSSLLSLLVFIAGISAASGTIVVTLLSLSSMVLNHVVLPLAQPSPDYNLYHWLVWVRRLLIVCIMGLSYAFYGLFTFEHTMTEMAILTFIGTLQFAPGLVSVLFWPRATRAGFLAGLSVGLLIWFSVLVIPYILNLPNFFTQLISINLRFFEDPIYWHHIGLGSTIANAVVMFVVSLITKQTASEQMAADSCAVDNLRRPYRWSLKAKSVEDFINSLSEVLGRLTAEREVEQALIDLSMSPEETRPYALRRLRDQIESNLSGLLGPSVAHEILDTHLSYQIRPETPASEDIHYVESRLEEYKHRMSGLAGELDALRRFHRQTLYDLPIGVCSLGRDLEIISWNRTLMEMTGISDDQIIGSGLHDLPEPWQSLLNDFLHSPNVQLYNQEVVSQSQSRWFNLHRAFIGEHEKAGDLSSSQVIVLEDVTELERLESQLAHNERLAALGRLAAGIAHEIGNPVTGIACLAQNLKAEYTDPEIIEASTLILTQTQRITNIVRSLVGFARTDAHMTASTYSAVNLHNVISEAINLLQLSGSKDYQFDNFCTDDILVRGNAQRLMQVFVNLLSNARDASPPASHIIVEAHTNGNYVHIDVEDFGHGLPEGTIRSTLFEPFVTTKETGKGTGLGLALVHGIIGEHGGKIQLMDKADYDQGRGVIVQITLPTWTDDMANEEANS
ncbi:MAG: ATPase [Moraxellaceae bacterium]|nr:ATPase [Moraxellaceae bacterium]MCP5176431.1 ATPase [Moraxellaceae bacterium]